MNIGSVVRAVEKQGELITLRRMTGAARVPFDAKIMAWVSIGAATLLIGGVEITADQIITTSIHLDEARWPGEPRHGDTVIYHDGRTAEVQGRASSINFDNGANSYTMTVLGAQ